MNKIFKRALSLIMCAVILALSGCAIEGKPQPVPSQNNNDDGERTFEHEISENEIGNAQSIKKKTPKYSCIAFYPSLGFKEIDKKLYETSYAQVDEFEKESEKDSEKYFFLFFSDYKVTAVQNEDMSRIFSVVFRNITESKPEGIYKDEIRAYNFDAKTQKEIKFFDVFNLGAAEFIAGKVREKIENADENKISAKAENFDNFSLRENEIIFYFDGGELNSEIKNYTEVSIPLKEIENYLKGEIKEILIKDEGESESQTDRETESETQQKTESVTNTKREESTVPVFVPKPDKTPHGTKYIAFTFDDGPSEKITKRILDILQKNNCKATFFVLGDRMEYSGYTNNLKRAYKMGCEIGNHGFNHTDLSKLSAEDRKKQIDDTNAAVKKVIGAEPTLFRPPYGDYKSYQSEIELPIVMWNIDTEDWKYKDKQSVPRSPAERERDKNIILSSVIDNVDNGDIILMHDLYDMTADAFEEMLPILLKRGYKLVTVSELYRIKGETMHGGKVYRGY